jgi:serine/threonine protein kinase
MPLDAEHWEQLQELFHLAENTPDAELDAVLQQACADSHLRHRAAILIRVSREPITSVPPARRTSSGGTIGPYTVLRHLGSGGIGSVYLVERTTAGAIQKSALKVLTRSAAGPFFTERFAREQHILASLDHPNITRLLDAGFSEEGEPFLTMEYVDGVHLDVYCDDHLLGIPERLQLFLRVCEAVAYAHRSLVVHLDLKPSNILVTEAGGIVKLLDFGTSKLIQPDSLLTTTVMATPAYASPEQLRNEPVTTVCDVYALGAILFELLSGRRPNQDSSVAAMIERSMKELPPESVTAAVTAAAAEHRGLTETRLRSTLTGDLATIAAKCINPRPKDRYVTVDALIADVQRYLVGRPILARPQTITYRLGKFVRRNRSTVVVGSLMLCCLLAVGGYAAWKREQAYREGQCALQMQTFMSELFKLANTNYMGKPAATVPEFLELGEKVLPDLIKDQADRLTAQLSLAESMQANGDLHAAQTLFASVIESAKSSGDVPVEAEAEAHQGSIDESLGQATEAAALGKHAVALASNRKVTPASRIYIKIAYAQQQEDEGYRTQENLDLLRSALEESRKSHVTENELAFAELSLATALVRTNLSEADQLAQQALALYNKEPYAICQQADANEHLALIHNQKGDTQGSLTFAKLSYASYVKCSGPDSRATLENQAYLAAAMLRAGQAAAVIPLLESSLPKWRALAQPNSDEMSAPLLFLSRAYIADKQFAKAEGTASELVRGEQGRVNPLSAQMAVCQMVLAQALAGEKKYHEAISYAQLADKAFLTENSQAPGTKHNAAKAHELLLELQKHVSATQ